MTGSMSWFPLIRLSSMKLEKSLKVILQSCFSICQIVWKTYRRNRPNIGQNLWTINILYNGFNVVKGFKYHLSDSFWLDVMDVLTENPVIGKSKLKKRKGARYLHHPILIKPSIGHIRNILLGWSMSKIYETNGVWCYKNTSYQWSRYCYL